MSLVFRSTIKDVASRERRRREFTGFPIRLLSLTIEDPPGFEWFERVRNSFEKGAKSIKRNKDLENTKQNRAEKELARRRRAKATPTSENFNGRGASMVVPERETRSYWVFVFMYNVQFV